MPTRSGLATVASAILLLAAGILADYPELVGLAAAGLAACLTAVVWVTVGHVEMSARREVRPLRAGVGDDVRGFLTVTNDGRRRSLPTTVIERLHPDPIVLRVPSLAVGESHYTTYPLPTRRRGVYQIGPLVVGGVDPLHLVRSGVERAGWSTLTVHPRVRDVPPLPTSLGHGADETLPGQAPRDGVAFHSLREYQLGDDWRRIHWKSTARCGSLMVRNSVTPSEPRTVVVLDTSADPYPGDLFEEATSVAASLCAGAARRGWALTLRTTSGAVAVIDGGREATQALDLLASVQPSPADPGLTALPGMIADSGGAALGVVTGEPGEDLPDVLSVIHPAEASMVSLIHLTGKGGQRTRSSPRGGVAEVRVSSCEEFVAVWNRMVRG